MIYASYEFYSYVYFGKSIEPSDFPRLALRASSYIDYCTAGRAEKHADLDAVKMACCAIAEAYQTIDAARSSASKSLSASVGVRGTTKPNRWKLVQNLSFRGVKRQRRAECGRKCTRSSYGDGENVSCWNWAFESKGVLRMSMFPHVVTLYTQKSIELPENKFEPTLVNHITVLRGVLLGRLQGR